MKLGNTYNLIDDETGEVLNHRGNKQSNMVQITCVTCNRKAYRFPNSKYCFDCLRRKK